MNKCLLVVFFLLLGCSEHPERPCKNDLNKCVLIKPESVLIEMDSRCRELSRCMKLDYEIAVFPEQPHDPYACRVYSKTKPHVDRFYYPKAEISFGEVVFERLSDAIATCEMMTETGESSKEYHKKLLKTFTETSQPRAEKKRSKEEPKELKKIMKIRVMNN